MEHSSKAHTSVTERAKQAEQSEQAIASKRSAAQCREQSEAQGAGVQKETSYASTTGQCAKSGEIIPGAKVSRMQLEALADLQRKGYERAGKLARVKNCGTIPIVSNQVALGVTQAGGVTVAGRCMCGSRWCADCWSRIASTRAEDVKHVTQWAHEQGFVLVLATFTAAHVTEKTLRECKGDNWAAVMRQDIGEIFDGLSSAWRYVHSGRQGKELKAGRVGYARGFELTTDQLGAKKITGTHGHYHVLLIFERGAEIEYQRDLMWKRWQEGCKRQGLRTSEEGFDWKIIRVDIDRHVNAAASYLVKGEKLDAAKIGAELSRGDQKVGRKECRTSPEGLLRAIGLMTDEEKQRKGAQAIAQWRGLEEACKGRRWLTWSRDLRKLAGLGKEKTDEEIANTSEDVAGEFMAVVEFEQVRDCIEDIRRVVREEKNAEKKWGVLLWCLDCLGISYEITTEQAWGEQVKKWLKMRRGVR